MTLDDLYSQVTTEILRAEHLDGVDQDAASASYLRVSELEEKIAKLLPADNEEGAAARRGVVTAALSAGDALRAFTFANRYIMEDGATEVLRKDLRRLKEESLAAIRNEAQRFARGEPV